MQTRRATFEDLLEMQHCNLRCLPENYNLRYYLYHYLSWPELLHVTHDYDNKVCGYVLAKLDDEEEDDKIHGHITSLAVLRTQRKLGIASKVMQKALDEMEEMTDATYCSLHVRRTNEAALHLYQHSLGFRCAEVDVGYYVDGEDAFHMKKVLTGRPQVGSIVNPDGTLTKVSSCDGMAPLISKKKWVMYHENLKKGGAAAAEAKAALAGGGVVVSSNKGDAGGHLTTTSGSQTPSASAAGGNAKKGKKGAAPTEPVKSAAEIAAEIEAELKASSSNNKGGSGGNSKKKGGKK